MLSKSPSPLLAALRASLDALVKHDAHCGRPPMTWFQIRRRLQGGAAHLQVWWMGTGSRTASDLLWDRITCPEVSADELARVEEELGGHLEGKELSWKALDASAVREEPPEPPMFRYQPQRVRSVLPFGQGLSAVGRNLTGGLTEAVRERIVELVSSSFRGDDVPQGEGGAIRARLRNEEVDPRGYFHAVDGFSFFSLFEGAGRHIFDIPPRLAEMFEHTDIDDVPGDMLNLPYSTFYICFGPQADMELTPGWLLDGAYVSMTAAGMLQICVTAAPSDVGRYRRYDEGFEPFYVQAIPAERLKMGIGEAVELGLAAKMMELRDDIRRGGSPGFDEAAEKAAAHGIGLTEARVEKSKQELADIERRHAVYLKMLRLVVNATIYLTAYPEDAPQEWPEDTPGQLRHQVTDSKSWKKSRDAATRLLALGYTAVHVCGQQLGKNEAAAAVARGSDRADDDGARHLTWRRGFYIRQAHGPQFSLRKLQWRMPQLVHVVGAGGGEPPGHLYLVS